MTAIRYNYLLAFGILFCAGTSARAQTPGNTIPDTTYQSFLNQHYQNRLGSSSGIFNGIEYTSTYPETKGSPFFHELAFTDGSLWYDGSFYPHVPLLYDMASGALCTKGPQQQSLQLLPSKILRFTIDGHHFLSVNREDKYLPEGFYDVLYENHALSFLVNRKKVPVRSLSTEEPYTFRIYQSYIIRVDSSYYSISRKSDILDLFPSVKKELKKHWSDQKLDLKKAPEAAVLETLGYYEKIKGGL